MPKSPDQNPGYPVTRGEYLKKIFTHYLTSEIKSKKPKILSVGCGFGYDAKPLTELFPQASYLGIDTDGRMISAAQKIYSASGKNIQFQEKDATSLASFGRGSWDLILLEQPQVQGTNQDIHSARNWDLILDNSLKKLSKDGTLMVLTDFLEEKNDIQLRIEVSGGKVIKSEGNQAPVETTQGGLFRGDYIILAKK